MDHVLAVLDHEEDLVLPAQLVSHLLDALQRYSLLRLAVFRLEDVA